MFYSNNVSCDCGITEVIVKKIGYDLGYEDGCELGCKLGMSDGYKFVKKKKEQRMQTQRARQNARASEDTTQTNTGKSPHNRVGTTHSAEDSNTKGRSLTLLSLRRGEKEAARGVNGVAGALALRIPATISSSVWHDEEEGSKERTKEEIKGKWSTIKHENKTNKIRRREEIDGATMSTTRCARRDEFDYATMRMIRPRGGRRCTISKIPQEEGTQRRLRGVHAINDV